nr:Chain A, drp2-a [synthetic construct]7W8R_A Chain A, drp2-b [synthetic construct]
GCPPCESCHSGESTFWCYWEALCPPC